MTHPPHAILRILLPICLLMTAAPALGAEGVKQERPFEFSVGKGLSLGSNSMIGGLSMASRIGTRFGNIHPYIGFEHLKVQVSADGENYSGGLTVVGPGALVEGQLQQGADVVGSRLEDEGQLALEGELAVEAGPVGHLLRLVDLCGW